LQGLPLSAIDFRGNKAFCIFVNLFHCLLQHSLLLAVHGPPNRVSVCCASDDLSPLEILSRSQKTNASRVVYCSVLLDISCDAAVMKLEATSLAWRNSRPMFCAVTWRDLMVLSLPLLSPPRHRERIENMQSRWWTPG
jgi:hypothetical protein